jgi:hypothetical protein
MFVHMYAHAFTHNHRLKCQAYWTCIQLAILITCILRYRVVGLKCGNVVSLRQSRTIRKVHLFEHPQIPWFTIALPRNAVFLGGDFLTEPVGLPLSQPKAATRLPLMTKAASLAKGVFGSLTGFTRWHKQYSDLCSREPWLLHT